MICHFAVHAHCNEIGGRVWNPAIRWSRKHAVFVTLRDRNGREGLGECWCFDSSPDALAAFLRTEIAPAVLGVAIEEVPRRIAALQRRATLTARHGILACAASGIDLAIWDLRAQEAGLPLWRLLAPNGTGVARFYGSAGLYADDKDTDALTREMAELAASGFDLVKMKVGGLPIREDLARVSAVLLALPAATRLIIDGVYAYDAEAALALFRSLPAERIEAFQSPVPAGDWDGMRSLSAAGVPVMAVEAEYRPEIHEAMIADRMVRFLQVAPVACGGPTRVLELCDRLAGTGIGLSLEVSSTAVATLAAAHLAAAHPAIMHAEFHTLHQVFFSRMELPRAPCQPGLRMPATQPGIGFTLTRDLADTVFEKGLG